MKIEDRISSVQEQAREVVSITQTELGRRIVYLNRAHVMVGVVRDALATMAQTEAAAVPTDFDNTDWYTVKRQLEEARQTFSRIINNGSTDHPPCRPNQYQ